MRQDSNRPMARLLAWATGKPRDVTVADTYAEPHLDATTLTAAAAAGKAAANKEIKYSALSNTHIFLPVAFETCSQRLADASAL